jgi:hypothetical protein
MAKLCRKKILVQRICEVAAMEMMETEDTNTQNQAFDEAFEQLLVVQAMRTTVPRVMVPKSCQWYSTILPSLDDYRFKVHMRVSRHDFGRILAMIESDPVFHGPNSWKQFPVEKQLAISLFKFGFDGTGSSLVNTAALFGIGDGGSVMIAVERVIKVE